MSVKKRAATVEYDEVSADYLDKRQLRKGAAGWVLLASLGVSYVLAKPFTTEELSRAVHSAQE